LVLYTGEPEPSQAFSWLTADPATWDRVRTACGTWARMLGTGSVSPATMAKYYDECLEHAAGTSRAVFAGDMPYDTSSKVGLEARQAVRTGHFYYDINSNTKQLVTR
jgi:predicted TIM-barrel fold metal-dependent hydrolase